MTPARFARRAQYNLESVRLVWIVQGGLVAAYRAAARAPMHDHPPTPCVLLDGDTRHHAATA